jgi:hypothetical protein
MHSLNREKSSLKTWAASVIKKKKKSPNGRKFAESGHPGLAIQA